MRGVILAWGLIVFIVFSLSATAEEVIIQVGHKRLEPSEVSISTGGTVTFHNQDEMPGGHTIMADDCSFKSPELAKDESWSHTFTKPGTYAYHIKQHPEAKGKIVVK